MLPLILTVLNKDYHRGVLESLLRTVRIAGNIPILKGYLGFLAWVFVGLEASTRNPKP